MNEQRKRNAKNSHLTEEEQNCRLTFNFANISNTPTVGPFCEEKNFGNSSNEK